jgi:FtsH-binding integral membrane protein
MADFETNRIARDQAAAASAIDAGLRKYMLQVYNYMLLALVVTGITAYAVYTASVTADASAAVAQLHSGEYLTAFGRLLFVSPLKWAFMFGPLVVSLFIYGRVRNGSVAGAQLCFWLFAVLIGASMATIFMVYTVTSIAQVFFITAAAFGGLSLWGYTTKRDLSGFGSFLIMGVWGVIIASVVNIWLQNDMMMWAVSVAGVGIFAGLTAYYSQSIKEMYYVGDDGAVTSKKAILGALALYISFINMFQMLLSLLGGRR